MRIPVYHISHIYLNHKISSPILRESAQGCVSTPDRLASGRTDQTQSKSHCWIVFDSVGIQRGAEGRAWRDLLVQLGKEVTPKIVGGR
jgi:hypothetical protein